LKLKIRDTVPLNLLRLVAWKSFMIIKWLVQANFQNSEAAVKEVVTPGKTASP
jgi:hypothetical protein